MQLINERRVELRERYGVRRSGNEIVRSDGVVSDRELLGDKLFKGLTDALVEAELAVLKTGRDGREEVYIDPKVADVYMAALAGEMAKRMKFLPVTNNPADHLAVSGLEVARLGEALLGLDVRPIARSEIAERMAVLGIEMVLPRTLDGVPIKKVVKFRQEHEEELRGYQEFVDKLAAPDAPLGDLAEIDDPRALGDHLKAVYRMELKPKVESLRKELNGIGIETTHSAATVVLKRLGKIGTVGAGAGAVAMGAVASPFATFSLPQARSA